MIFGSVSPRDAVGAILAHSTKAGDSSFKKGRVLSEQDIVALEQAGVVQILVARLEAGDVPEDEAASELALALAGNGARAAAPFTGRANIFATTHGVLDYDTKLIEAINLIDESITIATLPPYDTVSERQMLATIKIIPFAVPRVALDKALTLLHEATGRMQVLAYRSSKVGLVATTLPSLKSSILDKTRKVLDARLSAMNSEIIQEIRCPHEEKAVAEAVSKLLAQGCSPVLVFGASANVDRRDVVPAGIVRAGGEILHFGMPVDPGNLMLLARHGEVPVIGLPGCARSPKLNGFDFILARVIAGLPITREDVMRMGVGGLLKEIPTRPQPREGGDTIPHAAPRVAAIVLAAGSSSRMGTNKLLAEIEGKPMILRVVEAATSAQARPIIVVTGHQDDALRTALSGKSVTFAHNPDYVDGLATSLKAGIAALPATIDGVLICLGDMPDISTAHLERLISAFDPLEGRSICVPVFSGKRGNPVLWGAEYFDEIRSLKGDVGAKHLIGEHADEVCEVAMPDDATLNDIDTPDALAKRRGQ
jgi:molybdenum cofactor cytidylyltransferase